LRVQSVLSADKSTPLSLIAAQKYNFINRLQALF
jgi:hypothetical protein